MKMALDFLSITGISSTAKTSTIYYLCLLLIASYAICLLLINFIPRVRVKSLGWLALRGVSITLPDATITIQRIELKLSVAWRSVTPFRMVNLKLSGVVVVKNTNEKDTQGKHKGEGASKSKSTDLPEFPLATEAVSFLLPKRVCDLIFQKKWLNELSVHLNHISFYHHAFDRDVSLHVDYVKIENTSRIEQASDELTISVLDGYINDVAEGSTLGRLRLFHALELSVKCDLVFACPPKNVQKLEVSLFNFNILVVLTELRICKLAQLIEMRNRHGLDSKETRALPSLQCILSKLNMISSIQLKLEQSEIHYKEVMLRSSSYSLNYVRDKSYKQQTMAKLSSYVTAATMHHLELKCVDMPSITYILDIDLSDFYRALESENKNDFTIDLFTTLNMTNPSFSVYFDQLAYLLDALPAGTSADSSTPLPIQNNMCLYTKHIRKSSVKLMIVDFKVQLHMPNDESGSFLRMSLANVVSNGGAQVLAFKFSSKNLGSLIAQKCSSNAQVALKSYLKLRNVYVEVEENKISLLGLSALIGYCLNSHKIALRISTKRFQLKSVNSMIFHVIRSIREARINSSNRACAKLNGSPKSEIPTLPLDQLKQEFLDLFEVLPPIIHSIKFRAALFLSYIICNDWLPLHVIHDDELGEDIDMADFKRGVSFFASGLEFDYKREEEVFEVRMKKVQANTLSEFASEYVEDFDRKNTDPLREVELSDNASMESGLSEISLIAAQDSVKTVKKVLSVEDVILRNPAGNRNKLLLSIPEIEARADIYLAWCITYAITLVEMIAPRVERTYSPEQARQLKSVSKVVDLDIEVASFSVVARLPHDVDVLLEIDNLSLINAAVAPRCKTSYVRLYVVNPSTKLWSRFVSVSDLDIDFNVVSEKLISLKSRAIRFNIPFQYLVFTVIDNVITFAKAVRQIKVNFTHLSKQIHDYKRIEPEAKGPLEIPRVQVISDVMGITLENDDFESQLSLIYQFGKIENVERNRKLASFEKKAQAIRAQAKDSLSTSHVESRRFLRKLHSTKRKPNALTKALFKEHGHNGSHSKKSALKDTFSGTSEERGTEASSKSGTSSKLREVFCGTDTKNSEHVQKLHSKKSQLRDHSSSETQYDDVGEEAEDEEEHGTDTRLTQDDAEALIAEAYQELLQDFSTSWINKFEKYKHTYNESWKRRMTSIWGSDTINKLMRSKFEIQEYSRGPPLFQGVFTDLNFIVDDPHLEDVHDFLHKYGKGQPHLEYSILIPAFIHLRSSSVQMSLRDYELPFISFPKSRDPDAPVMDLSGTVVINEKLVLIPEELRKIFVPFSPATKCLSFVDNFYSVEVIRTLAPVKFMFDLKSSLNTDRACVISWCKAYQPALSSAMMAFENFTKPEIDDSPIGWWDKVALNAHGKIRFDVKNELCLHMKSSLSPYELLGNNSGLVFCWKDNVLLRINETGKHSELVILQSDDFILGIPNYSATEGKAWSLLNLDSDIHNSDDDGDGEAGKYQKRVMKLTSDEKVTWKLGFLFERNKDVNSRELSADMERTDQFKPHYDVTVTGPQYDYHPDSYEGYRSDYTHLAISVNSSSKKGNSHNYAYFTPLTFEYFKVWWKTLTDGVSLPIREGKLFAKLAFKESSVKWGPHLFTIKYQLVIEPLSVSDIYLSSSGKDTDHHVVAYGAKAKAEKCVIDLHQRREIARYVNEKLGIDKKVRKLKMNIGEVDVSEADIRLIFAQFEDMSMIGKLLSYYSGESNQALDLDTYEKLIEENNARSKASRNRLVGEEKDFSWIDFDDFVEMEENEILSPNTEVKVIPFMKTPRFTYFREFTLEHPEGAHPFGHEASHQCLIGANSPEEVQTQLVELRATEVKGELDEAMKKSKKFLNSQNAHDNSKRRQHEKNIANWQKKARYLEKMRGPVAGKSPNSSTEDLDISNAKMPSIVNSRNGSVNDLKSQLSRALLTYTAISSMEQAREIINSNSLLSNYHNRFLIHNLKMNWNNQVRDVFTSFLSVMGHRRTEELSMSRKALDLMEKLLQGAEHKKRQSRGEPSFVSETRFACGNDVIAAFEEYLTSLDSSSQEIDPKYIVKFLKPQVYFQSDMNPGACVLMTSKDIELRVFCVNEAGSDGIITESDENTSLLETRYGVLATDSRVWAFQTNELGVSAETPWLNLEDQDDLKVHEKNLVFERMTIAFSLKKPNMLAINFDEHPRQSEVVIHMAKLVVNATCVQYCALYYILTDLLVHGNQKNYFLQRIEQISSVSEASDFANLAEKVRILQNNIRICKFLILKMNQRTLKLSEGKRREHSHIKLELCRMKIELCIIIKSLEAKSSNLNDLKAMSRVWTVNVDQLIFHILDDARKPLVDFAMASSKFTRLEEANGSNANSVSVSLMQGFNLQEGAVYPELLRPLMGSENVKSGEESYNTEKPMISMQWKMLNPVGGIRVMSNAELTVQPIQIQLDRETATALFKYLFPKEEELANKGAPVKKSDGSKAANDSSSMDGSGSGSDEHESNEGNITPLSPTQTLKKIWNRSKFSKSDSSSSYSRSSFFKDTFSGDSVSMTSSEGPVSNEKHWEKPSEKTQTTKHVRKNTGDKNAKVSDDISEIMCRSAKYFVVGEFRVNKMKLCVSFKATGNLNIIDVHNLDFSLPCIEYRDKTWTSDDFVEQLKKDVIKIFLSHTGRIIGNKFKTKNRKRASTPLKQISDFSHYMTLEDLQEDAAARNSKGLGHESPETAEEPGHRSHIPTHGELLLSTIASRRNLTFEETLEDVDEKEEIEQIRDKEDSVKTNRRVYSMNLNGEVVAGNTTGSDSSPRHVFEIS